MCKQTFHNFACSHGGTVEDHCELYNPPFSIMFCDNYTIEVYDHAELCSAWICAQSKEFIIYYGMYTTWEGLRPRCEAKLQAANNCRAKINQANAKALITQDATQIRTLDILKSYLETNYHELRSEGMDLKMKIKALEGSMNEARNRRLANPTASLGDIPGFGKLAPSIPKTPEGFALHPTAPIVPQQPLSKLQTLSVNGLNSYVSSKSAASPLATSTHRSLIKLGSSSITPTHKPLKRTPKSKSQSKPTFTVSESGGTRRSKRLSTKQKVSYEEPSSSPSSSPSPSKSIVTMQPSTSKKRGSLLSNVTLLSQRRKNPDEGEHANAESEDDSEASTTTAVGSWKYTSSPSKQEPMSASQSRFPPTLSGAGTAPMTFNVLPILKHKMLESAEQVFRDALHAKMEKRNRIGILQTPWSFLGGTLEQSLSGNGLQQSLQGSTTPGFLSSLFMEAFTTNTTMLSGITADYGGQQPTYTAEPFPTLGDNTMQEYPPDPLMGFAPADTARISDGTIDRVGLHDRMMANNLNTGLEAPLDTQANPGFNSSYINMPQPVGDQAMPGLNPQLGSTFG
ncbi:hypothetical protein H2203_004761 [Taxawa tesnikishii (nom. ined.)]|nr:hypothetical protein H2203_004761 [Dothideales sp. JES 119]